jgi:Arc/MetJ-type ribon-helix-helix transcriptional regulator
METVTIKVGKELADEMKRVMSPNYSTKTEFIRDAIRGKIKEIDRDEALQNLQKYFGKAKTRTTDKKLEQIREEVGRELFRKYEEK